MVELVWLVGLVWLAGLVWLVGFAMKIERFEELQCWQEARKLLKMIYDLTRKKEFSKDYRLKDQIIGAGISIMNNMAEGFDSQSNAEFMRFLKISRRHVSEAETCLYAALDQDYVHHDEFSVVFDQAELQRKLTDGLLRYLRSRERKKPSARPQKVSN